MGCKLKLHKVKKKDRYTLLDTKTLLLLRKYFKEYKPTEWFGCLKAKKEVSRLIEAYKTY